MSGVDLGIRNVTKAFGDHRAVDGVSLDVVAGDVLVILGPSGCGKTTLLRLIAGLEVPDAGDVWLAGKQVSIARRSLVPPHQRHIGFVFQDLALWPHLTVQQHLEFVLDSIGLSRPERRARVQEALALVRVEQFAARYPHRLSGGEQQRVALARAFVGHPQLLLMDEPLSGLDPDLRTALRGELLRLQRSSGVTMVCVTHDREEAAVLADHVIEMRTGRIVAKRVQGRKEERA